MFTSFLIFTIFWNLESQSIGNGAVSQEVGRGKVFDTRNTVKIVLKWNHQHRPNSGRMLTRKKNIRIQ